MGKRELRHNAGTKNPKNFPTEMVDHLCGEGTIICIFCGHRGGGACRNLKIKTIFKRIRLHGVTFKKNRRGIVNFY